MSASYTELTFVTDNLFIYAEANWQATESQSQSSNHHIKSSTKLHLSCIIMYLEHPQNWLIANRLRSLSLGSRFVNIENMGLIATLNNNFAFL